MTKDVDLVWGKPAGLRVAIWRTIFKRCHFLATGRYYGERPCSVNAMTHRPLVQIDSSAGSHYGKKNEEEEEERKNLKYP